MKKRDTEIKIGRERGRGRGKEMVKEDRRIKKEVAKRRGCGERGRWVGGMKVGVEQNHVCENCKI